MVMRFVPVHSRVFLFKRDYEGNVICLLSGMLLLINRMPLRKTFEFLFLIDHSIKHFYLGSYLGLIEDDIFFLNSINKITRKHCTSVICS